MAMPSPHDLPEDPHSTLLSSILSIQRPYTPLARRIFNIEVGHKVRPYGGNTTLCNVEVGHKARSYGGNAILCNVEIRKKPRPYGGKLALCSMEVRFKVQPYGGNAILCNVEFGCKVRIYGGNAMLYNVGGGHKARCYRKNTTPVLGGRGDLAGGMGGYVILGAGARLDAIWKIRHHTHAIASREEHLS